MYLENVGANGQIRTDDLVITNTLRGHCIQTTYAGVFTIYRHNHGGKP